jgi:Holliday junction resolvase RusA-like endonuclease
MITILGNLYSTKNHTVIARRRGTGKPFVMKSYPAKKQEIDLLWQLKGQLVEWKKMMEGKRYPLEVTLKIYRATAQRFDYVNIVQGLFDAMVKAGYFPDDNADYLIPRFLPYEVDKSNPRIIITN